MTINRCKIVNNTIIKNVKKGSPDTTCSEPSVIGINSTKKSLKYFLIIYCKNLLMIIVYFFIEINF